MKLLEALAKIADLSPYHFHRLFKKTVGISPRECLIRRRIERAKTLLGERPDMTLNRLRLVSDARTNHIFAICFKKREGMTARKYKKT